MAPMLELENLCFDYPHGDYRLGPVSLGVEAGEWVGLIGPNGSGKSTLLRLIAGTLPPRAGSVRIQGRPLARMGAAERAGLVAVVPQFSPPRFDLSVREVVALGRIGRLRFPHRRVFGHAIHSEAVERALAMTDLDHLARRSFAALSGGEAQRVLLAVGLAQETPVLLLDEPTTHLDPGHARDFLLLVERLVQEEQKTVVMAYHDLTTVGLFCRRLWVVDNGAIQLDGEPQTVLTSPVIESVYRMPFLALDHPGRHLPVLLFP